MLKRIKIKNFRCLKEADVEFAPITLFYGPNGAGKSSILYAPFVFRNIITNPNQTTDTFFNLLFTNLGGFEQVVYLHESKNYIEIEVTVLDDGNNEVMYGVSLGKKEGRFWITASDKKVDLALPVTFPYPANAQKQSVVKVDDIDISIVWNGITTNISAQPQTTQGIEAAQELQKSLNKPVEILRSLDIVPFKRGFSKASYSSTPITYLMTEEEVATLLAANPYLEGEVMANFRKIFGKIFKVRPQIGTALFYLQVTDEFGVTNELVNDGAGINQSIFLLSKILRNDVSTIFVEEPEIHLHPSAQNKLSKILAQIAKEGRKNIILETHSEVMVSAFLSLVAEKSITPQDIKCYFITKSKRETVIEEQHVNEKGQIKGGLISFMEEEIKNIKAILNVKGEK